MKWFKFYGQDWLTDLKIINMPIEDRLCFITLLCLASSSEDKGKIRNCSEETVVRLTQLDDNAMKRVTGVIKRLHDNGMITSDNAGCVSIKNFVTRQGENLTSYERVKRYREKQSKAKNKVIKVNKKVINDNVDDNANDNARIEENRREENNTIALTSSAEDISLLIDSFKNVNQSYSKWFKNKTQRSACDRLIQKNGLEQVMKIVLQLSKSNTIKYFPVITTPLQLEDKFSSLHSAWERYKVEKTPKVTEIKKY